MQVAAYDQAACIAAAGRRGEERHCAASVRGIALLLRGRVSLVDVDATGGVRAAVHRLDDGGTPLPTHTTPPSCAPSHRYDLRQEERQPSARGHRLPPSHIHTPTHPLKN